jgi:hypothetical protein
VWEADNAALKSDGEIWRVIIDFPFDRDHHTPFDDLNKLEQFRITNREGSRTLVWLPSFFSEGMKTELGRFVILEFLLSNDDRLRQYSSNLSLADRAEAKTVLTNQRDQLKERLRRALRMAYGVMIAEQGILDEGLRLEKDQQFQSLDPSVVIRPPAAADLRSALDNLIEQALDGQYPAHPKFNKDDMKLSNALVQQAFSSICEALEAPDSRVAIDRDVRKKLRPLLDPLELAHVGEQFLAVKTVWFDRFDPREAQLPNRTATVGHLRHWMNEPTPMGLPDVLENLVILTYSRQASRMLTLQSIPVPESLTNLRDDVVLERQALPDQADWEEVASRTSHIFGVTLQPLPNLANLQKLDTQVRELVTKYSGEVVNYVSKLRTTLSQLCGGCDGFPRLKTAESMIALCTAIQKTRKPLDLFEAIRLAQMDTSAAGMGVVLKQAATIHTAIDQIRRDAFEKLGQVQDEPRSSVAQGLRHQIQDVLEADEHVTALGGVVRQWMNDAMNLLFERPALPLVTPAIQPDPPLMTPPQVVQAGRKVLTGSRRGHGQFGWKSIAEEIERELTDDAELEITWRIEKKSV